MGNKISNKIILCVVICSVLISAVVGITAIKESTSVVKDEAYGKILSIAARKGNEYSVEIEKTENTVKEYAQIISDNIDMSKVKDGEYMNSFQSQYASLTNSIGVSNNGIVGLYINFNPELTGGEQPYDLAYFYEEGTKYRGIYYNSYKMDEYYEDNEELSWYYNPIKEKRGVWSKPYIDPESNNIEMISYTMPVYKDNKLLGVAGLDISFENLQKMILDTNLYDTGNAFLLDKDYTFIVDKNRTSKDNLSTMEDGKYNYITEEIKNNKESVLEANIKGKKVVIGYYTLSNGQIVGVRVPTEEVLNGMKSLISIMVIVISVGMILSSILGLYISRKISIPIESATSFIRKLGRLDLTEGEQSIHNMISNKDETGIMIESLVKQREELIKIVKVLKKNSLQILQDTDIISTAENETVESIAMIANVMEQLLERAGEQAREVKNGSFKLNTLASEIEEIVDSISKLEQNSKDMQKMKEHGSESLKSMAQELRGSLRNVSNADNVIDEILVKLNLMEDFVNVIMLISEQNNNLIIAKPIESENAEENNKDIRVVDERIIKLSEKSMEFTDNVQDILNDIREELKWSKGKIGDYKGAFNKVNDMMTVSTEAFDGIGKSAENTISQIGNLVVSINKLNEDKNDVLVSIEEISLLTEEVAVSVENVTANIAEQEVAMTSTSERTRELKKVSETLGEVVEKFKI